MITILGTGRKTMLDVVRLALERVRSGESGFEEIKLPSGAWLRIYSDESSPIGVRIQTPGAPGTTCPQSPEDPYLVNGRMDFLSPATP